MSGGVVSVIVPVLDEPRVASAVEAVLGQDLSADEILVVGTSASNVVPAHPRVRCVDNGRPPAPGANRNAGIALARGDVLVFLDADCIPQPGWLRGLVGALERAPVASGAVALDGGSFWATAYNVATFHEFRAGLPPGPRAYLPTLTLAVRRAAATEVGPLDETMPRCEDMEWTIRLAQRGHALAFAPEAVVAHRPAASPHGVWHKWAQTGYYSAQVRRRYPQAGYSLHAAGLMARPWALRLLAPAVALAATARIFRAADLRRFARAAPVVWLTRLAWCYGAARSPNASAPDATASSRAV